MNVKDRLDIRGCRALIAAILAQAFNDAIVSYPKTTEVLRNKRSAIAFIDEKNEMFITYCEMLNLDPEYVARRMQENIRKHSFKPLKQFRE